MTGIAKETATQHFMRLRSLLKMEYDYEKREYEKQSNEMDVQRAVSRGICWYPVRLGRGYYNSLNLFVVEVYRDDECDTEHAFEYGKQVNFFYEGIDGKVRQFNFHSLVSYAEDNRMVVSLPSSATLQNLESVAKLGVRIAFDETSFQAMQSAIDDVMSAKENRLAELRSILTGETKPAFRKLFPIHFPWLNPSQDSAVNKVLNCRDVMIVHGPPGTGKTTTLVEAIYETLNREPQVLVCAQSNMAVDWISEKLVDRGVPVLRVGNPARVNDKMLSFTYERQFESHPLYPELWSIRKTIRELTAGRKKMSHSDSSALANRLRNLRKRAVELEVQINNELFNSTRVVASTLVGSSNKLLHGMRFPSLFIDEAGQALEPACWIAIKKADRVILAGDHCQLPPTITCIEAERAGLSKTLMERIVKLHPEFVSLLTVQYRMNKAIMQFSSDWFYGGALTAAKEVESRNILDFDTPIEWIDTGDKDFAEKFISAGNGRINPEEGDFFYEKLEEYVSRIGIPRIIEENIDFALISPYKAQVQYLRRKLRKSSILRQLRSRITVNTIDGFQGQERDVVLISLVRSNTEGQIGFLSDLRRMNVAITRARMKLIIIGNAGTLAKHPFYKRLHQYTQALE